MLRTGAVLLLSIPAGSSRLAAADQRVKLPLLTGAAELSRQLRFKLLHRFCRGELAQPRVVIFMCGLPGAGKSTIAERRYRPAQQASSVVWLDLDAELSTHPRFNPSDPDKLYVEKGNKAYEWADARIEARYQAALADDSLKRIVVDGTGTNAERQRHRMQEAREAGFFVKVLFVDIPLETAVRRAAHRPRPVSAAKIHSYHAKIHSALVQMHDLADEFETFDAPSHDPPHVLAREGYKDKSRTIVAAEEAQRQRLMLERTRQIEIRRRLTTADLGSVAAFTV